MPGAVLLILKIIGIIFLCMGIIFLYLIFVPFFYRFDGDIDKKDYRFSLHDPLRLYNVVFINEGDEREFKLCFLFNLIKLRPGEKKKSKKSDTPKDAPSERGIAEESTADENEKTKKPEKTVKKKRPGIGAVVGLIAKEGNRAAISHIIKKVMGFLKHLMPKRFYADMEFSLGSPDMTGYVTGLLSVLPYIYSNKGGIYPDFESERMYVSGKIGVRGWCMAVRIIIMATSIIANKNVRKLIGDVRDL